VVSEKKLAFKSQCEQNCFLFCVWNFECCTFWDFTSLSRDVSLSWWLAAMPTVRGGWVVPANGIIACMLWD